MLKSILKDPRLNNKSINLTIIILPPLQPVLLDNQLNFDTNFEYLASHVIPVNSTFTSRLKKSDKRYKIQDRDKEYQLLFTLNDSIVYKTNNGYIYHDSKRAKIINTELLYTNPENYVCTHIILHIDKPFIVCNSYRIEAITLNSKAVEEMQHLNDLSFEDMMNRFFPNENVTTKMDKLVLKFCDTSVHCDSLNSLHDCMENILDEGYDLIENLDMSSITTDSDIIFGSFESYLMESTYDVAFFKITQLLLEKDRILSTALEDIEYLDFSQVGLPSSIKDERSRVHSAISEFERIGSFRTPAEKLDCLLNTVSELTKDETFNSTFLDSDSLIPLLLITLIRSKVPHLTANLIYMKDYTFERNIVTGKYGYALSTFEGVLDYILNAHLDLKKLSRQNIQFWSAIQTGDLDQVITLNSLSHDVCDIYGNNPLMMACIHHQPEIAKYFLSTNNSNSNCINDMNSTPLMLAIRRGKSLETVEVLLTDPSIVESIGSCVDNFGNTALLYACSIDNLDILRALMEIEDTIDLNQHINTLTGDSVLHVAAKNGCSLQFMQYVMKHCDTDLLNKINNKHETFYHLLRTEDAVREITCYHDSIVMHALDETGRSPFMTWAYKGRLDLIELIVAQHEDNNTVFDYYSRVDQHGRNVLHLLSMHLTKGLTLGEKSLDYMIEKFRNLINVRDWSHGNTPLHFAAETSTLASSQNINTTISFIRALVKYGAVMDAPNFRDEYPISISRLSQLKTLLDELHLAVDSSFAPVMKHSMYQYSWYVTRPWIEQNPDDHSSEIYYVVKSGQIGKPESMRIVKRRLQDFLFLRAELLYEMPELFLPTFQQMINPTAVDLKPPPLAWIDIALTRLQSFMNWLQYHPVLRYHDLVVSFVRSSAELQRSMIRDNSFSRRKLLLEKISDLPLPSSITSSKDEEYFLTYAQDMMRPLKEHFLNILMTGRNMLCSNQELKSEMLMVAQYSTNLSQHVPILPLAIETIQTCANLSCDRSYVSPWPQLFKVCQMAYDIIDGILVSLNKPFTLLEERNELRQEIEQQKEVLRTSKNWQSMFSLKDRKKHSDYDKEKVIQSMNELNHIDGQINQSHKMISDELAHFQSIHPKEVIKTIKNISRSALAMEKHKLSVLEQTMSKWNNNTTSPTC